MPDFFGAEDILNMNDPDINFRMAFTIESYNDKKRKDDPRFVKWNVRFYGVKNGEAYETWIPYHKCTEEDYAQFNPLDPKA